MAQLSARALAALIGPITERPAYLGLADALRLLVTDGRVRNGTRLPAERSITTELGLSRTTVAAALDVLRDSGFVRTRHGSGSILTLPTELGVGRPSRAGLIPEPQVEGVRSLTHAAIAAAPGVMAAYERALPRYLAGDGYEVQGLPELRSAIADRYAARGLPTSPEQIIVTSGAHASLVAALRTVAALGDRIVVEDPTYPNALVGMRRTGYRLEALPIGPAGWDVDVLRSALRPRRGSAPSLAYLVPDFQNPTGLVMSATDREAFGVELARAGVTPIIDETFAELWIDAPPPPPFAATAEGAITIGSTSKAYWGGVRVGWARVPAAVVGDFIEARHSFDLGTAVLEQLVATELLRADDSVMDTRRAMVRAGRDALVTALRTHLPDWRFQVPTGGLALWCELPVGVGDWLVHQAGELGVRLAGSRHFSIDGRLERSRAAPRRPRSQRRLPTVKAPSPSPTSWLT